jgi:acyl dehydratase
MPEITLLPVGHEFAPVHLQLRPEEVEVYVSAVEESNPLFRQQGLVPPTALAAYALGCVLREIALPPGAVHASQEVSFSSAVASEEAIVFNTKVAQNALRGGWRFLGFDFTGVNADGKQVVEGRTTVIVPGDQDGKGIDEAR